MSLLTTVAIIAEGNRQPDETRWCALFHLEQRRVRRCDPTKVRAWTHIFFHVTLLIIF